MKYLDYNGTPAESADIPAPTPDECCLEFSRRQRIIDAIRKRHGDDPAENGPDPSFRDSEGYECGHCGAAFVLGTKHYRCRRCNETICYPGCNDSACPGWGEGDDSLPPGFSIVTADSD